MTSRDLLLSILAMDSYNRGYDEGISGLGGLNSRIGSARFIRESDIADNSPGVTAGFYASAYTLADGTTVISYRGTDGFLGPASDILNGWVAGAGAQTSQTAMALSFFNAVTRDFGADYSKLTLTGHSLGGGLAGMLSWLSGAQGVVFDYMPFGLVSSIIASQHSDPANPRPLYTGSVRGEYVINDILQSVRDGSMVEALSYIGRDPGIRGDLILLALASYLGVPVDPLRPTSSISQIAEKMRALDNLVPKTAIESYSGVGGSELIDRSTEMHMMDYLVNLKFAQMTNHTEWQTIGKEFFKAYFNDDIGLAVRYDQIGGKTNPAGKMGRAIAYSTLGYDNDATEGLVFGNSAAKAMFDDLDDLGREMKGSNATSEERTE